MLITTITLRILSLLFCVPLAFGAASSATLSKTVDGYKEKMRKAPELKEKLKLLSQLKDEAADAKRNGTKDQNMYMTQVQVFLALIDDEKFDKKDCEKIKVSIRHNYDPQNDEDDLKPEDLLEAPQYVKDTFDVLDILCSAK